MSAPKRILTPGEGRLWAATEPLPDESRASWIQRLCGDHQLNFAQLIRLVGFKPRRMDWDKSLSISGWDRLLWKAGMNRDDLYHATEWLTQMHAEMGSDHLLLMHESKPCYRWCGACIEADRVPHLRWYWRLAFVRVCWTHGTPLNDECAACGHPFLVDQSRLTRRHALTLAECARCGCSLIHQEGYPGGYDWPEQQRYRKTIARVWRFELFEAPVLRIGGPPFGSDEDTDFRAWVYMPTSPAPRPWVGHLQSQLAARSSEPTPASSAKRVSKAEASRRADKKAAREEWFARQLALMQGEEGRVRMREQSRVVHGIEPRIHGRESGRARANRTLPWHWTLPVAQRMSLALSLRTIRRESRLNRISARGSQP